MRTKKAIYNIITSLLLQLVSVVCGFVVPRVIISGYGSETNGLITSITQFLGYISLMEAGIGGVVRAALYRPLARNDTEKINKVLKASNVFFKRVAWFSVIYVIILAIVYPIIVIGQFDYFLTFSLVIIVSISIFAQYYFGITYQLLLQANQKQYVGSLLQIGTLILNALLVVVLVKMNCSVVLVKLVSSFVFVLRPLIINVIVKKRYNINSRCDYDKNALKKKRDGFAHHIAYFLHTNTDVVVLSIFSTMKEVSVYSVYYMIVAGVQRIVSIFSSGLEATFGNMLANNERENLMKKFNMVDVFSTLIANIMFMTTAMSIMPFIKIYTNGITDANYDQYLLGIFLILAEYMFCIRTPYNSLIVGAGHFKETKMSAYVEAALNIVLSVLLVWFWGINGVALATFVAMSYRTVYYVYYLKKNLIHRSMWLFVKKIFVTMVVGTISFLACWKMNIFSDVSGYGRWFMRATESFLIISAICVSVSYLFYKQEFALMHSILRKVVKSVKHKLKKKVRLLCKK